MDQSLKALQDLQIMMFPHLPKCKDAAKELFLLLHESPAIAAMMDGIPEPDALAFRIPFGPAGEAEAAITHLSVTVPLDAPENRGPRPRCVECALVGPNGLAFMDGLGYDNPKRFFSDESYLSVAQKIEAEIHRLLPYAQGKKEIPDYPESESEEESEAEPMDVDP